MSFSIYAAGTRGYRFRRQNQPDEDMFQAASVISAVQGMEPTAGGVAGAAIELGRDQVGLGTPNAMDAARILGRTVFVNGVVETVDMLCARNGDRPGWIYVSCSQSHLLWPATTAHTNYGLDFRGDGVGRDFVRHLVPVLTATGFNHYGSFRALYLALNGYDAVLQDSDLVMITINLSQ